MTDSTPADLTAEPDDVDVWPDVEETLAPDTDPEAAAGGDVSSATASEAAYSDSLLPPTAPAEQVLAQPEPKPRAVARLAARLPEPVARRFGAASNTNAATMRKIAAAMKDAGLRVEFVKGWEGRGRPGAFTPRGLIEHHDASGKSTGNRGALGIIVNGRPGISGPLSQFQVGRDGTWYIVAAGRANHAGEGGAKAGIPKDSANKYLYGVEVANDGRGEPYSDALMRSLDVGFACILGVLGRKAGSIVAHKEWAPGRKSDPVLSMADRRKRVAALLSAGTKGAFLRAKKPVPPKPAPQPTVPAALRADGSGSDRWLGLYQPPCSGVDVDNVRNALRVAGNRTLPAEGPYDRAVADLIAKFQANRKITERGVGPLTWKALRKVVHG